MQKNSFNIIMMLVLVLIASSFSGCFDGNGGGSSPGDYAKNYLQGSKYTRIILEIDYVSGFSPSNQALETLEERIDRYCDKSEGTLRIRDSISSDVTSYSTEDLRDLESKNRDYNKQGTDMVIYCLYLDGEFKDDGNVIGLAYGPSSIAIFKEKIDDIDIPFWGPALGLTSSDYETSILVHEFGHLLALVNIGYESERSHEDDDHDNHCIYDSCVMYYSIETIDIYNLVLQEEREPPSDFGDDCKDDLSKLKLDQY
jgi:hypothetical protein